MVSVAFGIFPCKFSHNIAVVTCPCACRLRRLAQNGCRGSFLSGIFLVHFHTTGFLRHVHVHFDCQEASSRELARRSCQETSCSEILPRDLPQGSCQQSSYRDLVQESCLQRSCQDTSSGDLVRRHCIEICCRDLAKRSLT